jgi:hypothetical protein
MYRWLLVLALVRGGRSGERAGARRVGPRRDRGLA